MVPITKQTVPYTNDAYPDIAYLLIFNRIPLQERVRLRIICQRWKTIIEADCAQMSTLRVFGKATHLGDYLVRTGHHPIPPPTPKDPLKYDPSPLNTIILSRPGWDRVDLLFLARLFPAISHLALTWQFGEQKLSRFQAESPVNQKKIKLDSFNDSPDIEPDIFALLATWAPTLRSLYLVTLSYRLGVSWSTSSEPACLCVRRSADFWETLHLMAPNLKKLTFQGVDLKSAPPSLTLPVLEQLMHYYANINFDGSQILSPEEMNHLAPAVTYFGMPLACPSDQIINWRSRNIWPWAFPSTVRRILLFIEPPEELQDHLTLPCPSIEQLELQLIDSPRQGYGDLLPLILAKFPNTKSLTIFRGNTFYRYLAEKGEQSVSPNFNPSRTTGNPFFGIEELHLGSIRNYYFKYAAKEKGADLYLSLFRALSVHFKGLKKLTLTVVPEREARHLKLSEKLAHLKRMYLPGVELKFTLEINVHKREKQFRVRPETVMAIERAHCYLSPGCVFAPHSN